MSTEVIRCGNGLRYSGSLCLSIGAGGIGGDANLVTDLSLWTEAAVRR